MLKNQHSRYPIAPVADQLGLSVYVLENFADPSIPWPETVWRALQEAVWHRVKVRKPAVAMLNIANWRRRGTSLRSKWLRLSRASRATVLVHASII